MYVAVGDEVTLGAGAGARYVVWPVAAGVGSVVGSVGSGVTSLAATADSRLPT